MLCESQSGFQPLDYCEFQLLSVVHEIYASFDCNPPLDVRAIFLDISKAFNRVSLDGFIYKMTILGITGPPLKQIQSFLGQNSSWTPVLAGILQGSVLGPLFFLIYINDLAEGISSTTNFFDDDTSLFSAVNNINESADQMNDDELFLWYG